MSSVDPLAGRNIILIGFMGTGKSVVGRRLARDLHRAFIDTDREVERRAGVSIADLFAVAGEPAFRDLEMAVVADLATRRGIVIATGGGTLLRPANRAALRGGLVVALTASPEVILARTRRRARPLLAVTDPLARIRALLAERRELYAAADLTVDTTALDADAVATEIRHRLTAGRD